MTEVNKFDQLVNDLNENKLHPSHVQNALREFYRRKLPESISGLVCGTGPDDPGYIAEMFRGMQLAIGAIELAYLRGKNTSI